MAKATEKSTGKKGSTKKEEAPDIDSKYRLIILAAQRSKQIQKGAAPKVEMDPRLHKPTRIALREIRDGRVDFDHVSEADEAEDAAEVLEA